MASDADLIVLAVGAAWNSDGENGDRATLGLSTDQSKQYLIIPFMDWS